MKTDHYATKAEVRALEDKLTQALEAQTKLFDVKLSAFIEQAALADKHHAERHAELRADMKALNEALRTDMKGQNSELRTDMKSLESSVRTMGQDLGQRLAKLEQSSSDSKSSFALRVTLAGVVIAALNVGATWAFKYLEHFPAPVQQQEK